MYFSDFFRILQKHFAKSIGDEELAAMLFDFVIVPANITSKGELLYVDKGKISRILKNTAPIHKKIRDHIFDKAVLEKLVESFEDNIVSELNPEKEDLCFQMMSIIKKENISPEHKAEFEILAQPETIAAFLAKVFIYAISTNSENQVKPELSLRENVSESQSVLSIVGISSGQHKIDKIKAIKVNDYLQILPDKYIADIKELYDEVSSIDVGNATKKDTIGNSLGIFEKCTLTEEDKTYIEGMAKSFDIELPDCFFDYGGLSINALQQRLNVYGSGISLTGTEEEKRKYILSKKLVQEIKAFLKKAAVYNAFEDIHCLALAVSNDGESYDEDVCIELKIQRDVFFSPEEVALMNQDVLTFLIKDSNNPFQIGRGVDYIDYEKSKRELSNRSNMRFDFPFERAIDIEDVKDSFNYYYILDKDFYHIEVTFDKVNQHTSVAFPNVILIKKIPKTIEYKIKSRATPGIVNGKIYIE